jgi:hypothetical protein
LGLAEKDGRPALAGPGLELPLAPEPVATAMAEGLLIPGLALGYLTLAAHGLALHGGVFMIDYLPALLGPAERLLGPERPMAAAPGGPLLGAGPLPIGFADALAPGGFSAAGALEAAGPFDEGFFSRLASAPLAAVRSFTLGDWYQEETPAALRPPGWESALGVPAIRLPEAAAP